MTPEHKEDLVCAFHCDLEGYMTRIERKVDRIETKLSELSLWRARVIGYAAGVAGAVSLCLKLIWK